MPPFLEALRPQQWVKNGLVFAALVFANRLFDPAAFLTVCAAFAVFCAVSSCVYVFNDLRDLEEDRKHPEKANRPLARGDLAPGTARGLAIGLGVGGLSGALALGTPFAGIVALYLGSNVAYSIRLKHVVILDVMTLALGFVLRAVAGGVVIDVEISPWLVICTTLLALFLGFGKRRGELVLLEDHAADHRPILGEYSPYFLDQMIAVVTASTVVAYCMYTLSPEVREKHGDLLLTVPFVLYGIFRYLYLVHQKGEGGNPTRVLLTDRHLVATIGLWLLTATAILYL